MKKQSIAEQTLNKQIKRITSSMAGLVEQRDMLDVQWETLRQQKEELEIEVRRLELARQHASDSRKPANDRN